MGPHIKKLQLLQTRTEVFDERAKRWDAHSVDRSDDLSRADLASRWQQWAATAELLNEPKKVPTDDVDRRKKKGNWWWNRGCPPVQATVSLQRGHTQMNTMVELAMTHPLLVLPGTDEANLLLMDGKVNEKSKAESGMEFGGVEFGGSSEPG